jgi:hypothetical protein
VLGLFLVLSCGLHRALNWGHDLRSGTSSALQVVEEAQPAATGIYLRANPTAGAPLVTVRGIETPSLWDEFLGIAGGEYRRIKQWFRPLWALSVMAVAAFVAALLVSWRVNINLFSLHHFYRNRLTRCYLGATNRKRRPHPLSGSADIDYPFVSLSDDGDFENLGIYELMRRRCAVILASDAGADPKYSFGDLAEAIRKCNTDFGVKFHFKHKVDNLYPPSARGQGAG